MRKPVLLTTAALVLPFAPVPAAAAGATTAAETGMFSQLFEEPTGADCVSAFDPRPRCKPTANAVSQLTDGRQIYWSGLEGMDDVTATNSIVTGYGTTALNSAARIMDMRGKSTRWSVPDEFDSGVNPDGNADNEYLPGGLHNNDVVANDGDLFCADLNFLADGRIITNGGTAYYQEPGIPGNPEFGIVELNGLKNTRIFDPRTNSWSEAGKMSRGRWYPTMVTQPDGTSLTFSGVTKLIKPFYPDRPGDSFANERHLERFDPRTMSWTELPDSAKKSLPLFPRMHLLPDGRTLFNAGGQVFNPAGYAYDEATWNFTSVFDPETDTWTDLGLNDFAGLPLGFRGSGFSMMLMLGPGDTTARFLSAGGVIGTTPGTYVGQAAATITEIDTETDGFRSFQTGSLHTPRWYSDGVMLPTGQVWTVNGGDRDHLITPGADFANLTTEMYDPTAGEWTQTASQANGRSYHPTGMLLPDGRVLVGGHAPVGTLYGPPNDLPKDTLGATNGYADPSFQIFSPPNLFYGKRPVITGVKPTVKTGQILTVKVDRPAEVSSVRMLRNTSLTHLVDGDQRNVELEVVGRTAKAVKVAVPGSTYLPPGPYMLFAHVDSEKGEIPSVSRQVFVDAKLPAAQVAALTKRQVDLVRSELRAAAPTAPVTQDPAGGALPAPLPGQDSAVLPGPAARTAVGRRARIGRRVSATLVRRAR